ncbi:hypothetical protein ACRS6K_09595 [Bacillus cytotoxicus]|nr:hypothetical protein [Bacillus cytotoxicus]SCN30961.1 Protein of unknown function [Bacillus cytotoxicus]
MIVAVLSIALVWTIIHNLIQMEQNSHLQTVDGDEISLSDYKGKK